MDKKQIHEIIQLLMDKATVFLAYGVVLLYMKDLVSRIVDWTKLKFSDFRVGTRIRIKGETGWITRVGLTEVEIKIDDPDDHLYFKIPIHTFVASPKVIVRSDGFRKLGDKK